MTGWTQDPTYDAILAPGFIVVACTGVAAGFMHTPYGRFADLRFGLRLDPRLGWFLMELPAPLSFISFFARGPHRNQPFALFVLFVWCVHYGYRDFVMPAWFADPRFIAGVTIYVVGLMGNIHSDHILRTLRPRDEVARGERRYRIPTGGLYRWVTTRLT